MSTHATGSRYCIPHMLRSVLGRHGAGGAVPLYQRVWHTDSSSTTIHDQHFLGRRLLEEYFGTEGDDVQLDQQHRRHRHGKVRPSLTGSSGHGDFWAGGQEKWLLQQLPGL